MDACLGFCLLLQGIAISPFAYGSISAGGVKALVEVARSAQKEKVFRAAMSTLRNMLNYEELGLASDMVEAGLPKIVATRQMQVKNHRYVGAHMHGSSFFLVSITYHMSICVSLILF